MKKIYTSILTLLLLTVALGSGVYAWFTINTKASADGLTGSAQTADGGFFISLTGGSDWHTHIDFSTETGLMNKTFTFKDLTTNGNDLVGLDGSTLGVVAEDYIEFDLHFLTGDLNRFVYLTELKIETTQTTSWIAERTVGSVTAGDIMNAKLEDAMRVSFGTTIFENIAGVAETVGTSEVTFGNTTGFTGFAHDYYEAVIGTELTLPDAREDIVLGENGVVNQLIMEVKDAADSSLTGLDESFSNTGSLKVRVWLEGWDGQAFNAVGSGEVSVSFKLAVRES